jgi:UDP-glucose 4-epimerase
MHFAGLKAVGESEEYPLKYYLNNFLGSFNILNLMNEFGVKNLVFSSSATVYGLPKNGVCKESDPVLPKSVYGRTKAMVENLIIDFANSDPNFRYGILRYFNPVGANKSGLIGEDPIGIPNNLIPFVTQVAIGRREKLFIWGNDYPTPDGTGMRDYIHVEDLAAGHIAAIERLGQGSESFIVNLGTGNSHSVLEVVKTFERVTGRKIPFEFADRRIGDVPECYADPSRASELLNWQAKQDLETMCEDVWRWQTINPNGYRN